MLMQLIIIRVISKNIKSNNNDNNNYYNFCKIN